MGLSLSIAWRVPISRNMPHEQGTEPETLGTRGMRNDGKEGGEGFEGLAVVSGGDRGWSR